MSRNTPKRWRNSARRLLVGTLLLPLAVFLAWFASRRFDCDQTSPPPEPASGTVRETSPPDRSNEPVAARPPTRPPTVTQVSAQTVLKYGRAATELGMVRDAGQTPVGPESFAVTGDGNILIADVVNQRVAVYSRGGRHLRNLDLPGLALGDVAVDKRGRIFIYDQVSRVLHQFDADGTPRGSLILNPADIDTRGYFHVVGEAVYFADAAARDVLVATLADGVLRPPPASTERQTDGIHAASGRIYSVHLVRNEALQLQIRAPTGQSVARNLEVASPGIVSARFVGEDLAQRFYVQSERLDGKGIVLEVLAFSPAGEPLTTTRMPENDYALWTAKLVDLGADGTIVQFLPQREQAQLNLFVN